MKKINKFFESTSFLLIALIIFMFLFSENVREILTIDDDDDDVADAEADDDLGRAVG